jgi:uncharacterized protein YydD (DUF2326 family)
LTVAAAHLKDIESQVVTFRILPEYSDLEAEADRLTHAINAHSNENVIDAAAIHDLERAMKSEAPPVLSDLESVYSEAGIVLPNLTIRRYEEVRRFHESIVRNRRDYLMDELNLARERIATRECEKSRLDARRADIMGILQSFGALDQFSRLQGEMGRMESEVESLRQRFEAAEQIEGAKNELEIERNRLTLRLRRD